MKYGISFINQMQAKFPDDIVNINWVLAYSARAERWRSWAHCGRIKVECAGFPFYKITWANDDYLKYKDEFYPEETHKYTNYSGRIRRRHH